MLITEGKYRYPDIWKNVLELICDILKDKTFNDVFPCRDEGRIKYFIHLWEKIDNKPEWLSNVLTFLKQKMIK
jgi:hypothetical protein